MKSIANKQYSKSNVQVFFLLTLVSFLISVILQCSMTQFKIENDGSPLILTYTPIQGYLQENNHFLVIQEDPQLAVSYTGFVQNLQINMDEPLQQDIIIELFYTGKDDTEHLQSKIVTAESGQNQVEIILPYDEYNLIRLDIGTECDQEFSLTGVNVYSEEFSFSDFLQAFLRAWDGLTTFGLFLIVMAAVLYIYHYRNHQKYIHGAYSLLCGGLFLFWAIIQPLNASPDEMMRYDLVQYVFQNNHLPHGGDPAIRNSIWGFSYGFFPYLSGMIGAVLMKVCSLLTSDEGILLIAARLPSVIAGTISVFFITKSSVKLFHNQWFQWIFILSVSLLPQYVFLASYINNDMMALCGISVVLYYWLNGMEKMWDSQSLLGLSLGLSIIILSYYNAYSYVLMSILLCFIFCFAMKMDRKEIARRFFTVFLITFLLSGWFFIRNAVLYNGDILGRVTANAYGEAYAMEQFRPSVKMTIAQQGISLWDMLFSLGWLSLTFKSFVGVFGYMSIYMEDHFYVIYKVYLSAGLCLYALWACTSAIKGMIHKSFGNITRNPEKLRRILFETCLLASGLITLYLAVNYSYTSDFQPQGRYTMPAIFAVMYFTVRGYQVLFQVFEDRHIRLTFICPCIILMLILCVLQATGVFISNYV